MRLARHTPPNCGRVLVTACHHACHRLNPDLSFTAATSASTVTSTRRQTRMPNPSKISHANHEKHLSALSRKRLQIRFQTFVEPVIHMSTQSQYFTQALHAYTDKAAANIDLRRRASTHPLIGNASDKPHLVSACYPHKHAANYA